MATRVAQRETGGTRPFPPADLANPLRHPEGFQPAPDVWEWALATFVRRGAPLHNPEHAHLEIASVGVVWTNVQNSRHMRGIVGMAEVPDTQGGNWKKARAEHQLREWFGAELDFLITLDAPWSARIGDAEFCALLEHEMYHCGHARDQFGAPKFTRSGRPKYALRGHDVEEFVGIVRRYGAGPAAGGVAEFVRAAKRKPEVAPAQIEAACGSCGAVL